MDLETDEEFLFIAEEGLKAPVPEPWKTYFNENDEIFYVNSVTNEKMYDHPLDEEYRQKFLRLKAEKDKELGLGQKAVGNPNIMQQANNLLGMSNKAQDPLIRAEAEKKLKEHRQMYQQEYQMNIEEIDRNFLLKKQELIKQNEDEIESEKQKWDKYKKDQEKKIRDEIEADVDSKIANFKDDLKRDEEREMGKTQAEVKQKLVDFERELGNKHDVEKQQLDQYYERLRKTIEESEQERFSFEIEKFKNEQNKILEGKKVDIDKLKSEKRKIQQEYDDQIDQMKRDMDRKLEREKRDLNEQCQRDMDETERDEKAKYERKLAQMKRELALASAAPDMEKELNEYRQQQELEYDQQVREFKRE